MLGTIDLIVRMEIRQRSNNKNIKSISCFRLEIRMNEWEISLKDNKKKERKRIPSIRKPMILLKEILRILIKLKEIVEFKIKQLEK